MTYATEFMILMLKRLAKRGCPHCSERGMAGNRVHSDDPVICQCAVQDIVKYRSLRRPDPIHQLKVFRRGANDSNHKTV